MLHLLRNDPFPTDKATFLPPLPDVLRDLGRAFGIVIDPFYTDLYRVFGGHAAPDGSMVTLWSPARIVAEKETMLIDTKRYVAIGDLMIDSDLLMVSLEEAGAPAYLRYAGDRIAESAVDLVETILTGRLAL